MQSIKEESIKETLIWLVVTQITLGLTILFLGELNALSIGAGDIFWRNFFMIIQAVVEPIALLNAGLVVCLYAIFVYVIVSDLGDNNA